MNIGFYDRNFYPEDLNLFTEALERKAIKKRKSKRKITNKHENSNNK